MKTQYLFVATLTMLVFASCQKEVSDFGEQPGLDTYAGMTISLPKELIKSRALVDGTTEESKINSVKVGAWSDGDNAITYTTLSGSEFTNDGTGNYTATKAIKAKTGRNNFIVIANSDEKLTIAQVNGEALIDSVAGIATDKNFVMYSKEVKSLPNVKLASKEEVELATSGDPLYTSNRTSVTLRRAAAKVVVTSSLGATDKNTGVPDASGKGLLYNIKWNIANQNEHMTAIVNKLDKSGAFTVKNVKSPFSKIPHLRPDTVGGGGLALPEIGGAASYAYCLENSNGLGVYTENNTTAVHVTASFVLAAGKYVFQIEGSLAAPDITWAQEDLYINDAYYVFKKEFIGLPAGTFITSEAVRELERLLGRKLIRDDEILYYYKGLCHWVVYIHDGATPTPNYGVLRNHIYEMNINSIEGPGFAKFPQTDTPTKAYIQNAHIQNAHIQVDLSVKDWTDKDMDSIEW